MANINLLLVEDDRILQELYAERFGIAGFTVIQAFDGEEALEIIQSRKDIEMILLDIMLPKISGFDLLKIIRENEATAHLPVIVVSALADVEDQDRAMELGATDYITKGEMLPGGIIDKVKQYVFSMQKEKGQV